ncbi:MAG TPA: PBP1A family penicillin-binding protein [bacterium]|nr:PBP1A family penicillin-binding protein [bacterium]
MVRRALRSLALYVVLPLAVIGVGWTATTLWKYAQELPSIEEVYNIKPRLSTRLFDKNDQPFYEFFTERRVLTPLDSLPPHLVRALLATEDREFYNHWGVRWTAIVRALIVNFQTGRRAQGGSTITQQLARKLFLTPERTLERKIKEWLMSIKLERSYSKNEILEMYLNINYYGAGAYGIGAAAQTYFGKAPRDLDLMESAALVGVLPAPTAYSPTRNPELAMQRRNTVLRSLVAVGELDQTAYDTLSTQSIALHQPAQGSFGDFGDYFAEEVRRYVIKQYGDEALYTEGLNIYTTLDADLQRFAEEVVRDRLDSLRQVAEQRHSPTDPVYTYPVYDSASGRMVRVRKKMQAAMMLMDNRSGGVLAMVGGYDYKESEFNRVTQALRQPGSAFKPFVLTGALEAGFTPADTILDAPVLISIPGAPDYSPGNFDGKFEGPVSIRYGIRESRNLVSVRLLQKLNIHRVIDLAERMGISTKLLPYPSLAVGSSEVTVFDMTAAYSCFPNGGIRTTPTLIRRITDRNGKVIEDNSIPRREEVLPANLAYAVTHVLTAVVDSGTAASTRRRGFTRPAAGKTGTSNEYMDNWFVGFTPRFTCGVWVGYDLKTPIGGYHTGTGAATALPIWTAVMQEASKGTPVEYFEKPEDVYIISVCQDSNKRAGEHCNATREEVFLRAADTLDVCPLHNRDPRYLLPRRVRR